MFIPKSVFLRIINSRYYHAVYLSYRSVGAKKKNLILKKAIILDIKISNPFKNYSSKENDLV